MIRIDVAYLADIFEKLTIVNEQLQGITTTLIQVKGLILLFLSKLTLFDRISRVMNLVTYRVCVNWIWQTQ